MQKMQCMLRSTAFMPLNVTLRIFKLPQIELNHFLIKYRIVQRLLLNTQIIISMNGNLHKSLSNSKEIQFIEN